MHFFLDDYHLNQSLRGQHLIPLTTWRWQSQSIGLSAPELEILSSGDDLMKSKSSCKKEVEKDSSSTFLAATVVLWLFSFNRENIVADKYGRTLLKQCRVLRVFCSAPKRGNLSFVASKKERFSPLLFVCCISKSPESSRQKKRVKTFKRIESLITKVIFHSTYADAGMCRREGTVCLTAS